MHPNIRRVYDQGPAPKAGFLFFFFYIEDRIRDSFELKTMRLKWDETKIDRFFEKRLKQLLLKFLSKTWLWARSVTNNFKKHILGEFFISVLDTKLD